MKVFFAIILAIALGLVAVGYSVLMSPLDAQGAAVIFEVKPGEPGGQVIRRLKAQGLIKNEVALLIYGRLTGFAGAIRVGEYEVSPAMSALEITDVLISGKSFERSITFQEGLNIFEMAEAYEREKFGLKADFIKVSFDKNFIKALLGNDTGDEVSSLEGYLFPDTYRIDKFAGPEKLIEEMVNNFLKNYQTIEPLNRGQFSRHQLVTFASMVEKETGDPKERPLIASVFHNRLKKKMRLQSDPTIIYGIARRTGSMPLNITKKDILNPSPFNTYTVSALPYGPIANPGLESMRAVVEPATSDFLYFVSRNDGTHEFTSTYKDHNKAVTEWQRTRANREGKSWRDRAKKTSGAKN
jgi:UPF0755 protein